MPTPPPADQFWLLTGEVPSGPFTVAQVHAELAAGRANWQTPACPVGGSTWLPLVQTPGIGPSAPPRTAADTRSPDAHPSFPSVAPAPSSAEPAAVSLYEVFGAKHPVSTSTGRSPSATDALPVAPPTAPVTAHQDQPLQPTADPAANGPSRSNQPNQFWLLVGTETTGPFRAAHIRAKFQSGELHPDAKARRVGTEEWVSLTEAVGTLPPRPSAGPKPRPAEATAAENRPTSPPTPAHEPAAPLPSSGTATPAPDKTAEFVGAAIGIGILLLLIAGVGYGVYWAYEQLRPYTATEVCKKLDEVKTAVEARKYTTSRMHPFIDATYADKSALDPNDNFEWTQEVDGPQANTKLVGFRGTWFDQEAGQRVRVEGHCRVVRADGWKVDDMIITGVEGASLPGPVSLVDEHRRSLTAPKAPGSPSGGPANRGGATKTAVTTPRPSPVESWYERNKKFVGFLVVGLLMVLGKAISDARKK